jgi:hypothetical protein
MGLYPASMSHPAMAFTFQMLEYFHTDTMECRTSTSNYFNKLRRLTNESFPDTVPVSTAILTAAIVAFPSQDRYCELMHVSWQWQHLHVLKTFRFGHDTDWAPGNGDLAEFCPACPQPGVNLSTDWQQQPDQ